MKTIAIIESCDTKFEEAEFMREIVAAAGIRPQVIDVSTGFKPARNFDVSREEVAAFSGVTWSEMESKTKGEKITFMQTAVSKYVKAYFEKGQIDGVLSAGGVQNTMMATEAMKALPIGVPKVMATTIASGQKIFAPLVGERDVVVIPSICDFTGLNFITKQIMRNACACCIGMVLQDKAGRQIRKGDRPVVGVTLMGVTNTGACSAIAELTRQGFEAVGFHSTGVGGNIMEELALEGIIDGILDLTTHELSEGYMGGGFSYSPDWVNRINRTVKARIPLVVCPGGLDFIDFSVKEFPPRMEERAYMMHNKELAHIKVLPEEARAIAEDFARRVEQADYPVRVLIPTDGMRHNTMAGEELYRPDVDKIIIDEIRKIKNPNVEIIVIEGNLDTEQWGIEAAKVMADYLRKEEKGK